MISVLLPENNAAPKAPAKPVRADEASHSEPSSKDEFSALLPERADQADTKPSSASDGSNTDLAAVMAAPERPANAAPVLDGELLAGTVNSAATEAAAPEADPKTVITTSHPSDATIKVGPDADAMAALQTANENASMDPRTRPAGEVLEADPRVRPAGEILEADPRVRANDRTATEIAADASRGGATVAGQTADQDRRPLSGPLTADAVGRASPDSDRAATAAEIEAVQNTSRRDAAEADLATSADAQGRTTMAETSALDRAALQTVARDSAGMTADPLLPIAPTSSGPAAQVAQGLTPIAPSIPVASPSELSNVILNAVKNGGDVQEQLVVQLDPPELGRVTIDFKFDAQGLQQVVVTSENPEALKRLRELHFELTQALRDQGLADTNMSFQEQARDQSNSAWQASDGQDFSRPILATELSNTSVSATREQLQTAPRDRLDLLL